MIPFTCSCGKQLQAKEIHAGQRVQCPACGARVRIPDLDGDGPRSRRPSRERDYEDEAPPGRAGLIIGAIVAGVLALGAVVTVIILLVFTSNKSIDAGGKISASNERNIRAQSTNNLRQITLAMHNYNDSFHRLPPAVVYNQAGQPLYSWRVLLLPYVERQDLYNRFHFNEPWDSPHNKSLLSPMPRCYAHPGSSSTTDTHYLVFDGREAFATAAFTSSPQAGALRPFNAGIPPQYANQVFEAGITSSIPRTFMDGTSNTILVVEADKGVPWSQPVDLPFGSGASLPPLGGLYESQNFLVGLADASVRTVNRKTLSDATLRAAITANAGDVLGSDW